MLLPERNQAFGTFVDALAGEVEKTGLLCHFGQPAVFAAKSRVVGLAPEIGKYGFGMACFYQHKIQTRQMCNPFWQCPFGIGHQDIEPGGIE